MSESALDQTMFADMSNLEKTLSEDLSGDRARAMVVYFRNISQASHNMLSTTREGVERQLISRLMGGFNAAERIIKHVWETIHGTMLVL